MVRYVTDLYSALNEIKHQKVLGLFRQGQIGRDLKLTTHLLMTKVECA